MMSAPIRHVARPAGRRRSYVLLGLVAGMLPVGAAIAQNGEVNTNVGLRLSGGHSDNIQRQSFSAQSGSYRGIAILFNNTRNGRRLDTAFNGDVEYRKYSNPNIDSERIGSANARVDVDIVPEVFDWIFNESYGQGRVDPFRATAPTNRQQINIFSTGPRVNLRAGRRMIVRLSSIGTTRRFQNTGQLDSDNIDNQVGIFRELSPMTEIGLTFLRRDITYDNNPLLSWNVDTVAISYDRQLSRGSALIRAGKSTVDLGTIKRSSPLVDVNWNRRLGARSTLSVFGTQLQSDPADGFIRANILSGQIGIGANNAFLGPGVYDFREVGVNTTFNYLRTTLSMSVSRGEADYVASPTFSNQQRRATVGVVRQLSSRMNLGLNLRSFQRQFDVLGGGGDRDHNYRLWLTKRFVRRLSLQLSYYKWNRDARSNNPFEENVYQAAVVIDLNP